MMKNDMQKVVGRKQHERIGRTTQEKKPLGAFTTKRVERHAHVLMRMSETSAGSKPVRGFTLVESLVAITILTTAIVGPFYAVQQATNASFTARDQLIATSLAQEGVEYIRSVRDDNYLYNADASHVGSQVDWLRGLQNCRGTYTCMVDPTRNAFTDTAAIQICPSDNCTFLNLTTTYLYTQTGGSPSTRYKRSITIRDISATEVVITVTVSWKTLNTPYSVVVTEHLNNWL